jgi:CBS domain-containing protein
MKVSDVMSRHVQTVRDTDDVRKAMRAMLDGGFSGIPVVSDKGLLVGMLTEGDLMRRDETGTAKSRSFWQAFILGPERLARDYTEAHGRVVQEIMTAGAWTVEAADPLETGVALMEQHKVKRLPVLDAGRLVGMLSRSDLMRACLQAMEGADSTATGDAEIEKRIAQIVKAQPWAPNATVHFKVAKGDVTLCGVITSEAVRDALRILVENIPGVIKVADELTTIEPMSGCIVRSPG